MDAMMLAQKQQLVDAVKLWQRKSQSHKEAWYRFVKQNGPPVAAGPPIFDPGRHEVEFLSLFVDSANSGNIELLEPTGEFDATRAIGNTPIPNSGVCGGGGCGGGGGNGMMDMMMTMMNMMAQMNGGGSANNDSANALQTQFMLGTMMASTLMGGGNSLPSSGGEPAWKRARMPPPDRVAPPDRSNDPEGSGRVEIRGFDFQTTDLQIQQHMSQAGPVHAVHRMDKGAAVIVYTSSDSVPLSKTLDRSTIPGNKRYLDVLNQLSY